MEVLWQGAHKEPEELVALLVHLALGAIGEGSARVRLLSLHTGQASCLSDGTPCCIRLQVWKEERPQRNSLKDVCKQTQL
jgi:hypothetical protein